MATLAVAMPKLRRISPFCRTACSRKREHGTRISSCDRAPGLSELSYNAAIAEVAASHLWSVDYARLAHASQTPFS
jgi:hypothetical protein